MTIKQLNFVFTVENFLIIFRNAIFFSKLKRSLVFSLIIIDIVLTVANASDRLYSNFKLKARTVYYLSTLFNSVVTVILSCYHSGNMKTLLANLNANYTLPYDIICNKTKQQRKHIILNMSSFTFCAMKIALVIYYCSSKSSRSTFYLTLIYDFNYLICSCRSMYEYFVIMNILCIMLEQLQYIVRSIEEVIENNESEDDPREVNDKLSRFEDWNNIYICISDASKLLNSIFGIQVYIRRLSV